MGIYASWTMHRGAQSARSFRGALRSTDERGVIWECDHDHCALFAKTAALRCAEAEIAVRVGQVALAVQAAQTKDGE